MNKLLIWIVCMSAAIVAAPGRAQTGTVFAVSYNQPTNYFGTISLATGSFAKIGSIGRSNINDIAWCPTNGVLYGISNQSVLVKFNQTNGAMTQVASLSKSVLTLAFRSDGALFASSASKLYTINLASGKTTPVGDYGSPRNLNKAGQNIRFAADGNLYVSNTSTNTDIYQVNTSSGAATWMGEAVGYPNLKLQNSGQTMYGVSQASGTNKLAKLLALSLSSFVAGGTNANGSVHQITATLSGAGTNFPANVNFTGGASSQVNPPTVTTATAPQLRCANCQTSKVNQVVISWQSVTNQSYQLQCTTNLFGGVWTSLGSSVTGTGGMMSLTNNVSGVPKCFFRMASQ